MNIDVKSFLNNARHTVIREKLVNYHLFYEFKLAGARNDNEILFSFPEIDKEGYDIVLDDGEIVKVFQLKTILTGVKTNSWEFQKQLLRPIKNNLSLLGFENIDQNIGYQGGIILIEVEATKETIKNFHYYYCDIFTLKAMECGLILNETKRKIISASNVIKKLKSNGRFDRYEKIKISKGAFLKVANVDDLLALADLSSIKQDYRFWCMFFKSYLNNGKPVKERGEISNLLNHLLVS